MIDRGHPLDQLLQAFIGPRETRPPTDAPTDTVLRDLAAMREISLGMSNSYHEIDEGFEEQLREWEGSAFGRHAGWNFNGLVWFENGLFHEQVWVYRRPIKEISAPSLRELTSAVNAEFGAD